MFLPKEKVGRKDLFFLFICSFIGVVLNQTLFLAGLNLTTPINSAIILTMNPIAAFIFAAIILKEDISLIRGTGLAVGLTGVLLLILQGGRPDFGSSTFLGNLLTLGSTINWALYTVLIKKMLVKYQPVTVMKWTFLFSLLTTVPMGYSQLGTTGWSDFTLISWTSLAFVIIAATFLGYLLISSGLKNLSPTVVSSYTYSQPLIAAFIASMMGQDKIDMVKILSAILIFAGVYLVSKPDSIKIGTLKKSPVELP
jgi:drug/metabolite transporter (DMT)-like permease